MLYSGHFDQERALENTILHNDYLKKMESMDIEEIAMIKYQL